MPDIIIIAAMSRDRVIGSGDGMPWNVPAEYRHFVDTTRGQTLVMGRRSWEIFGGDVQTASNIVISHRAQIDGAVVAGSLAAALDLAAGYGRTVYIAGGGSVYSQALAADVVDAMYLSTIHGDFAGDTYFPAFDPAAWRVVRREERDGYTFVHYARQR